VATAHNHIELDDGTDLDSLTAWNHFVARHEAGNLLQTSQWGKLKSEFGWEWDLVTVGDVTAPRAGAVVLYRPLPLRLGTIAYVPRGPLVDWADRDLVAELFDRLHRTVRRRRAWACWVEPEMPDGAEAVAALAERGYRPSSRTIQPRSTILVDLTPSEDDILMAMKSKTRYNIRLAGRKDVTVRVGSVDDAGIFYDLMVETGERDEFGVHSEAYYRRALELFGPHDQVALFLAEYEGEPLAGLLAFAVGKKAWYIAGASSNRHRNRMPAYAIQWAAIRWAKALGCETYDLWGIPDAGEEQLEEQFADRSDGLWGVYRFKRGFGGAVTRYIGLWERPLNPFYPLASRLYDRVAS
jgi:lipid II:glycine glycyltransferase (peptidoglycan interpeptide bridge formation enzyme)